MVRIAQWTGRFGNNFSQYVSARVIAQRDNLYLETKWPHDDILKELPWDNKGVRIEPRAELTQCDYNRDKNCFYYDYSKIGVQMSGYWQDSRYIIDKRDEIRSWFDPSMYPRNTNDWVCHYRVSDYWLSRVNSVINPNWYLKILYRQGALNKKIYIVTEDPNDPCVKKLARLVKGEIVSRTVREDFHFIMSFDNIIGSNGSFAWWAMFLGNPKNAFMFDQWMRFHRNITIHNIPGVQWVNGDFANNKEMTSMWDDKIKNNIEKYWENWKCR